MRKDNRALVHAAKCTCLRRLGIGASCGYPERTSPLHPAPSLATIDAAIVSSPQARWNFWIDRGGTFTDVIGMSPEGALVLRKVPSTTAGEAGDAGLQAALSILLDCGASVADFGSLRVGTTVVTNALLERRGSKVLLVVDRGFADALTIGHQARPDIFALEVRRPLPLYAGVLEIDARVSVDGTVLQPLDETAVTVALTTAREQGFDAVAIVLMHGWRHTDHERRIAQLARTAGFATVIASHQCLPLPRLVPRGESTVFDAYLSSTLAEYVGRLQDEIRELSPEIQLEFMQSSGGLAAAEHFRALTSVLSGPAGGLIGMAAVGRNAGLTQLVGFDMGGTSTDVSVFDGAFERRFEHEIEGLRISTPMLDVHTIAAGGGSLLTLSEGRYRVGPRSAGADPGPACYGRGGPATLTDVQVILGRLQPEFMPRVFGVDRNELIQPTKSLIALRSVLGENTLETQTDADTAERPLLEAAAAGFLDVAIASMANAIRHVSVRQGVDPSTFTLVAFGGAAGQHACRVAEAAGLRQVLVHPLGSVLSAYGIGIADRIAVRRQGIALPLDEHALEQSRKVAAGLVDEARRILIGEHGMFGSTAVDLTVIHELRAGEAEYALDVVGTDLADLRAGFREQHEKRFGYATVNSLQIVAVRIEARLPSPHQALSPGIAAQGDAEARDFAARLPKKVRAWFNGWREVEVVAAYALEPGRVLQGPLLLVEPHSTFVLESDWRLSLDESGAWLATHAPDGSRVQPPTPPVDDPAQIEIFDGLFMHAATQMGEVLRRTAQSVNIKERLDYSCAIFDATGGLVANAPHMPVHLGSMGATVIALLREHGASMRPGDAWLTNAPSHGGTHLPDMTLVSPVFMDSDRPDFFVASRAHHADIGGITPGSMPPFSTTLSEEGAVFRGMLVLRDGEFRDSDLQDVFMRAPWPARNLQQNLFDLRAQLAANRCGIEELRRAVERHGRLRLQHAMRAVQDNAERCVRDAIRRLGNRDASCELELDRGERIAVRIVLDEKTGCGRVDFSGTSQAGAHNFNAPRAVTHAAVLYVFRTLVRDPIPLNAGCLRPLDIIVPPGCMLDPPDGCAVVAGNVETSQVIVDALYGALGQLAASQGTMNNLTFGNDRVQYYETIAGGAGAGHGFEGCSAVQTHMTNSRLTDPEILESRYPVLLRRFCIRQASGGEGRWRGGDGVIREIEFLEPLTGAMLANRRRIRPPGLVGGESAAAGITRIYRRDGSTEELAACARFELQAGDVLEISTPGGGGYGNPSDRATAGRAQI